MPIFKPSQTVRSIYDIDGDKLLRAGIKGIIFNWSNTLIPKNSVSASDSMKKWLKDFKSRYSIKLIIVSNSKPPAQGTELVNEIPALFEASKPKKKAFMAALDILGTRKNETAVIGNGIITDLWGGNRLGMYTIFVSHSWTKFRFIGAIKRLMVKVLRV
ncbi:MULTISPECIES: YqeG family HAD IIIA-type phosphatase [unclassified Paenibacillus]|uniref:YqeG family HAD IIIA-type phosphatase n=1 Tax=unclassified Paenibacillus TaxID=185978 RepID=UPI00278360DC|nr:MULTISPECIES: YqeG family HAD IIIA-type phosphatase [unclassified Paenibacillus]MDQ0900920.1 HAD superfamily phosphatase (TIGR01668 family) [Paenibacillus sp. V4I7]MDQ0920580.1 HAD superfamily phosphatase (TIGR01668 family) [Paenibacillus sp. V4I5]